MIKENLVVAGDPPVATLPDDAVRGIYNRCTPEQVALAMKRRRPQPAAPFATPVRVDDEVLASIPRSYVFTKHDRSMVPPLQCG